ncbi:MAG: SH3 domain-containing protein [Cohaesibacter sp.]|jgi:uncharacterized protein YgiM (DUF1202 family)|nr:SH3 domain-containing protein [Cohaesibacter sp.]
MNQVIKYAGLICLTMALSGVASARAETRFYNHNGSAVELTRNGQHVTIKYHLPRPGLSNIGIRKGTILFTGKLDGRAYMDGQARLFRKGCKPTTYYVYGDYRPGKTFVLTGTAPVLARSGCRVVDNRHDIDAAHLSFQPRTHDPSLSPQGSDRTSGKGACIQNLSHNGSLNLRAGPGGSYGVLAQLKAGTCGLTIHKRQNGWAALSFGNYRGWASLHYVGANQ